MKSNDLKVQVYKLIWEAVEIIELNLTLNTITVVAI
jgi:hypothetical protein